MSKESYWTEDPSGLLRVESGFKLSGRRPTRIPDSTATRPLGEAALRRVP